MLRIGMIVPPFLVSKLCPFDYFFFFKKNLCLINCCCMNFLLTAWCLNGRIMRRLRISCVKVKCFIFRSLYHLVCMFSWVDVGHDNRY